MKRLIKFATMALILALGTGSAWSGEALDRVMKNKLLKSATSASWAPQSFMNDKNEWDGFDIDVTKEIAKRLGVKVEFVTPAWDIMTAGNWYGRWDISVGSMTPTKARAKVLTFPAVYYYTPAGFAVHKDSSYKDKAELNGKRIGTTAASTYELYLKKDLVIDAVGAPAFKFDVTTTAKKIRSYKDSNTALDDLRIGDGKRLDAVLSAIPTINAAIKSGYPLRNIGTPAFYEPLSVAIDKGDKELQYMIAGIIKEMHEDGTLTALSIKWYKTDNTKTTN
ncbi:MAG: transporter substrate-binding domain-containing protein [Desulfobacula sp.]|nr:transporter substrate-binding domain-containing protein [Desulfobacula sp.]